jgi:PAS domain S-box-containing protein
MIVPHELIQALIVTASDAIMAADRTGVINFWNLGTDRIFGFRAHETIGRSLDLIIPHNLRAPHWAGFNRVMETGVSQYDHDDLLSVPAMTKSGQRIFVEFTIVVL